MLSASPHSTGCWCFQCTCTTHWNITQSQEFHSEKHHCSEVGICLVDRVKNSYFGVFFQPVPGRKRRPHYTWIIYMENWEVPTAAKPEALSQLGRRVKDEEIIHLVEKVIICVVVDSLFYYFFSLKSFLNTRLLGCPKCRLCVTLNTQCLLQN